MTLDIDIGDAADALAQNQLTDALDGTYWSDGWDATTRSGDLEVDISSGEGSYEGSTIETGSTETVDFDGDVDADDPRKAVIFVDEDENVEYELGDAIAADPEDKTRFRTWDPAPPADVDGVVVAEVWLGADASSVGSDDIRDRRVSNEAAESIGSQSLSMDSYADESGNRSLDTTYTNNTGNPLYVIADIEKDDDEYDSLAYNAEVDGDTIGGVSLSDQSIGDSVSITFLVPNNSDYQITTGAPSANILDWWESTLEI